MLGPTRRVRFTNAALRQANIREIHGPSLGKIQVKIPHQRSPYAMRRRKTLLKERLQDKSDAPSEKRGNLLRISTSSDEIQSDILFA